MSAAKKIAVAVALAGLLIPASQAAAAGAPAWQMSLIPLPTNMQAGSSGTTSEAPMYRLIATNIGAKETSGAVTLTTAFPAGITPLAEPNGDDGDQKSPNPICSTTGQEVTCTTPGPVYPSRWLGAKIPVEVSPSASGALDVKATISGGGAQPVSTVSPTEISPEAPDFGFLPGPAGLASLLTDEDGSASTRAGSRSNQLTINLGFPTEHAEEGPTRSAGHVRNVITNLPQGLIANPNFTSVRCTELQFLSNNDKAESNCPPASEIGIVTAMTELAGPSFVISHLYNMVPPPGAPAEVAFNALEVGIFIHLAGHVRSEGDYGITAISEDIVARTNNPILDVQAQIWGDPSAKSHNEIRGECLAVPSATCSVPEQSEPVLSMPSACSESLTFGARASSWEQPGVFDSREVPFTDPTGNPVGVNECSLLGFEPKLTVQPEANAAETPTGVQVDLEVPQNEGKGEPATSNLKDTTVTFPEGMALNPAAATGLSACTPAQIGLKTAIGAAPIHFTEDRPQCPPGSKIGSVEVETPLLNHPVPGAVYVAQPYQNPFNELLGVYVVIDDPADGIVAKLAGRTKIINNDTGQLQTTFTESPELPFEHFKVSLSGGPRAALRTPATCGTFTTTSLETPWSGTAPVPTADSFAISQGANGRPCATSESQLPNSPGFEAGTATPIAGSFSPFLGRLQRADGTQQLKGLNLTLSPGLSGKLAGIPSCPVAALDAAAVKTGVQEQQSPSCPAASQVGEVLVGAGSGPQPYYTSGKIYLSGPYNGGPVSAAIVTPAVAGPFDLGTVVTRAALYVNPATAQITVKSDPIPRQLQGIPLQVRDVQVNMSRPNFTLNPTSCDPKAISGEAISVFDQVAPLFQRFQVGGCKGLDYGPKLALSLKGGTKRGAHPKLRAVLTAKFGEANTARASVALPKSEFLENAHIQTVCTRVQFAAENCPAKSIYGHATATTPLLDEPLEGPVYLRSSSHKLPDMVAALEGPASRPIKVELDGRIDSVNGGIRSTFDLVPDQPVTKFVLSMQGGKKGLLVNSRNLCAGTNRAVAKFNGQNGKVHDFNPVLKNDCKKAQHPSPSSK